jgi:hypothetical protein
MARSARQSAGAALELLDSVVNVIVGAAVVDTTALVCAARVMRFAGRRDKAMEELPRTVMLTEPIICAGTVAALGRQSASAFATQRALSLS